MKNGTKVSSLTTTGGCIRCTTYECYVDDDDNSGVGGSSSSSVADIEILLLELTGILMGLSSFQCIRGSTRSGSSHNNNKSSSSSSSSPCSSTAGSAAGRCRLSITTRNSFTQTCDVRSAITLTGCIRLLCQSSGGASELWCSSSSNHHHHHDDGSIQSSIVESWMDVAQQTLLPIITATTTTTTSSISDNTTNVDMYTATVEDIIECIERTLFDEDHTYLVGGRSSPTIADVVIVILLCEILIICLNSTTNSSHNKKITTTTKNVVVVPQQTYRWIQTILQQLSSIVSSSTDVHDQSMMKRLIEYSNYIQEGVSSPTEKKKEKISNKSSSVTAAGIEATTTTTTKTKTNKTTKAVVESSSASAPTSTTSTTTTTTLSTTTTSTAAVSSSSSSENRILSLLDEYGIPYEAYEHKLSMTADELVSNVPLPVNETHTKNLFLRDKKHGLFLVTVCPDSVVNTKELGSNKLGLSGKVNLRLADEKLLDEILHVKPGCVGPLCIGMIDDENRKEDSPNKVTFVLDKKLVDVPESSSSFYKYIHSHPLRNDMSVKMTPSALFTYITEKCHFQPILLDFESSTTSTGSGGSGGGGGDTTTTTTATKPKPPPVSKTTTTTSKKKLDAESKVSSSSDKKSTKKGETLLALQWKKSENFAQWYTDVIVLSEMISYYDISGCYILRPWSYKMWELIQDWFNIKIEELGVENAYFPLFVSKDRLEKEKDHVEGFAPEVAWVTQSGSGDLAKPIAVRPTSETIMYPAYSDWIQSHRDLPLKLNQWSNVVRWEFKYPTPFLRTREFLWQEGHTAHATFEDADQMVMDALELYRGVYEDLLAVPVIKGYKTEKEKFAGGYRTTTCEAYIAGSGRAIQGATSHHLGQNFGKMFDISYQNSNGKSDIVWQTSWGLTTRTIGVMVMTHGDDIGLVLPPRIAPIQVVIVSIISSKLKADVVDPYCTSIIQDLKSKNIRCKYDNRTIYNPGWKYNHWEQKGVPIRIEIGPRDMEQKSARIVIRHNGTKHDYPIDELGNKIENLLSTIQDEMYNKARIARDEHIVQVTEWKDFVPNLEKNNLVLTPWCGGEYEDWEEWVKTKSREESLAIQHGQEGIVEDEKTSTSVAAKTLCIPFEQPKLPDNAKCIASGMNAKCWVLWGRSY